MSALEVAARLAAVIELIDDADYEAAINLCKEIMAAIHEEESS